MLMCDALGSGTALLRWCPGSWRKDDQDDLAGFDVAEYFGKRDPVGGEDHQDAGGGLRLCRLAAGHCFG